MGSVRTISFAAKLYAQSRFQVPIHFFCIPSTNLVSVLKKRYVQKCNVIIHTGTALACFVTHLDLIVNRKL